MWVLNVLFLFIHFLNKLNFHFKNLLFEHLLEVLMLSNSQFRPDVLNLLNTEKSI